MPKKADKSPADFIVPLYINGLEGRMLRMPDVNKKGREILFIYGQHSSLERWFGLAQSLNKEGAVTMPDLPGFGGMTNLYKIGLKASIDNLADYLATFTKLKYKRKKLTFIGMSLGFVIVTRMLQRYPELTDRLELLVSVVGFSHKDDFKFSRKRYWIYRLGSYFFSMKITSWIFQNIFLRPFFIKRTYASMEKLADLTGDEFQRTLETELVLWKINDTRTQMKTGHEMFKLDNTKPRINLPVYHVASRNDRYFDNLRVEQHFRRLFSNYYVFYTKDPSHAPTIIADAKTATPFVPTGLRRVMNKKRKRK